ncbi:aggregation-promoting factor C-terminal-like domain-containing protein [Geodermatophilus marinus]|uniref:aggregation-promoting factor C-terminal-like domain-containing protein n=1 Tax=Geodermatophilus sp. LHW52908 TaxID=2303986 RepID=UPI000E3C8287|nr:transglycosylase SLT domain-containing protein [Geodermatophilus sp. LHW52908]RFU18931.1 lytic transglycosylase domain-containing protein [Geodermatophilus sp. LHW52908]
MSRTSKYFRLPTRGRRPAVLLATATAGAVVVGVLAGGGQPATEAEAAETLPVSASQSVAEQLGLEPGDVGAGEALPAPDDLAALQDRAASRGEREAARASAAQAQAAADQAERDRQAAEAARIAEEQAAAAEAARVAEEQAAAQRAAEEAAAAAAAAPAPAPAPAPAAPQGSFKDYALAKVGSAQQFSCLENLWGKESGWDPNAQNPTSTAYGIAQFLDSTWASTGIAKTSDGYRQIDAGLIYIENRYGTPCAAWAHSQANNWY